MTSFYDLLVLAAWVGTFALVGWWLWGMRKAATRRKRTSREELELASLRAAIDRDREQMLRDLRPNADRTRPAP